MDTGIFNLIEEGKQLLNQIGGMLANNRYPDDNRSLLIIAYCDISIEHQRSIHLLIKKELYGSAFALVRPLWECIYRAHWVNGCATENQLKRIILKGKAEFPKMDAMVKAIDKEYKTENYWEIFKKKSWNAMNDYAHSGILQISRRFKDRSIEPNYTKEEIVEVLDGSNLAILLMTFFFFNVFRKKEEINLIKEMISSR